MQEDVQQLKALKAQYLEATGEDWDVKNGAKKPSAKSKAKGNQQARVEKLAAAEPVPEPAAEGDGDAAEDGVRPLEHARLLRSLARARENGRARPLLTRVQHTSA